MRVFEKSWARLLINVGVTLVMFIALFATAITNSDYIIAMIGMLTLGGQIFYFLAFDTFGDIESRKVEVLRNILTILGTIVVVVLCFFSFLIISGPTEFGSPWLGSLLTLWPLYNTINFFLLLIFMMKLGYIRHIIYCFTTCVSFILSYFLGVIFLYIGSSVNSFFNFYFGLILSVVLLAIIIIIIRKKRGVPFFGTVVRKIHEQWALEDFEQARGNRGTKSTDSGNDNDDVDNRKEASPGLWYDTMEKAVRRAVESARTGYYTGQYGKVDNLNFNWYVNKISGSVNVKGNITYRITSTISTLTESDVKDDVESVSEEVQNLVMNKIDDAIETCQNEYKGYDREWNIKVDMNYKTKK